MGGQIGRATVAAALASALVAGTLGSLVVSTVGALPAGAQPAADAGSVSTEVSDLSSPPEPYAPQAPSGHSVFVLNAWEYQMIPSIRAKFPGAMVLVYKDLSSSRTSACQGGVDQAELPTGVGYCWARANHPEWFLTGTDGQPLQESGYPTQYEMDYGNQGYQQQWLTNVTADVKGHGWDGVEIDNPLTKADAYGVAAKYPTDQSVQAATRSMLSVVGPGLQAQGIKAVANIGYATEFPGLWDDWMSLLSGAEQEYFLCWGEGGSSDYCEGGSTGWTTYEKEISDTAAMGKFVIAHSGDHSIDDDPHAFDYSLASYLMADDGSSDYAFGSSLSWHPEYGWDLGAASGGSYQVPGQTGVFKRDFRSGTALVNTGSSTVTVPLGATYLDASGNTVSSVTLAAVSGAVLRASGGSPSGPPGPSIGFYGSIGGTPLVRPVVGMASTPDGHGYWMVASDGGIFAFGDAPFYGSIGGTPLVRPVVGMASTPDGHGYWMVASDGGIFAFGDAPFYGSIGGTPLVRPVVGMASTPDGHGYWMVASDGGIFAFGDAPFYGSTGGMPLNQPIVGMATSPGGAGYWMVASDGGIFAFGDAPFHGSTGGMPLNQPIVGMATAPGGAGYWLVASDGGIFSFGRAHFWGSTGGLPLVAPIVGMAADGSGNGYWLGAADGGIFAEP